VKYQVFFFLSFFLFFLSCPFFYVPYLVFWIFFFREIRTCNNTGSLLSPHNPALYDTVTQIYLAKHIKWQLAVTTLQITLNYRDIKKPTPIQDWVKPQQHGNLDRPYQETAKLTFQLNSCWNLQIYYWKPWTALSIDLENTVADSAGKPYGFRGAKCFYLIKHTLKKNPTCNFFQFSASSFLPFIKCLFWKHQQIIKHCYECTNSKIE